MSSKQLLPLSGVVSIVVAIAAFILAGEPPDVDAPGSELVSYYGDNETDLQIAAALLALAALFFLIFSSTIASLLRGVRETSSVASKVSFGGGILVAIGVTLFASLAFTAADVAEEAEVATLQTLNALEMDMFFTVAVGTAAFLLGSGIGALKTGLLPRWLAWVAIVLGVIAVTPLGFASFVGLGIWTIVVSVMLAMRAGARGSGEGAPRAGEGTV